MKLSTEVAVVFAEKLLLKVKLALTVLKVSIKPKITTNTRLVLMNSLFEKTNIG